MISVFAQEFRKIRCILDQKREMKRAFFGAWGQALIHFRDEIAAQEEREAIDHAGTIEGGGRLLACRNELTKLKIMSPIKFKEQNVTYAENQPEYLPLPAHRTPEGEVIFCQQLTLRERFKILWTGKMWVSLLTFNQPLTPSFFTVNKSDLFRIEKPTHKRS